MASLREKFLFDAWFQRFSISSQNKLFLVQMLLNNWWKEMMRLLYTLDWKLPRRANISEHCYLSKWQQRQVMRYKMKQYRIWFNKSSTSITIDSQTVHQGVTIKIILMLPILGYVFLFMLYRAMYFTDGKWKSETFFLGNSQSDKQMLLEITLNSM